MPSRDDIWTWVLRVFAIGGLALGIYLILYGVAKQTGLAVERATIQEQQIEQRKKEPRYDCGPRNSLNFGFDD